MAGAGRSPTRVLVVSASPDARRSSASLRHAVAHLARDRERRVEWWFLRGGDGGGTDGPPAEVPDVSVRVVDHLRTSSISSALARVGAHAVAARVAGLRLRTWWRRAAPDVVVLDDGVGGRVLPERPPPVVVRVNPIGPAEAAESEARWSGPVAGRWYSPGALTDAADPSAVVAHERLGIEWNPPASPEAAVAARRAAGLPVDEPVVRWPAAEGDELAVVLGWLAAGDDRFDRPVHVVWVDPRLTTESHADVAAAARRAGVADRLHQRAAWSSGLERAVDGCVVRPDADADPVPGDAADDAADDAALGDAAGDAADDAALVDDVVRLVTEVASGVDR